jgi:hypothetical protein
MKQGLFWTVMGLVLGAAVAWALLGPPASLEAGSMHRGPAEVGSLNGASPQGL